MLKEKGIDILLLLCTEQKQGFYKHFCFINAPLNILQPAPLVCLNVVFGE